MGLISTHVLDTSRGVPAHGVGIELHRLDGNGRVPVAAATTNADGRTDAPLVAGDRLQTGIYELTFRAADYFARAGVPVTDPPFLGDVVIRVGIADPDGHYHVPLLLSPYGYSTYRGS
jgi:5-hydroxyisourate hydrolase